MVRYARGIDATVCAEGVETLEDLATLADIDVGCAQGYVLARPAPPWASVDSEAREVCDVSMRAAMDETSPAATNAAAAERRLELVAKAILGARWPADLQRAMGMIAGELDADHAGLLRLVPDDEGQLEAVAYSDGEKPGLRFPLSNFEVAASAVRERCAVQTRVSDPTAGSNATAELVRRGLSVLLVIPVISGDRVTGLLGVSRAHERPWTRSTLHRGWLLAHELGAAMAAFKRDGKELGNGRLTQRKDLASGGIDWMRRARKESRQGT
jgi:hypothetical protein